MTESDLMAELEKAVALQGKQAGEYTRAELLERCGSAWLLRKFLKENKSRIEQRQCGAREFFFRLK